MKTAYKNTVFLAVILGMVWQAHGQTQNATVNWRIVDASRTTNQRAKAQVRRGNVQLKLRDPADEYRKFESQMEKRQTAQTQTDSRKRRVARKPLSIPQALTRRVPNASQGKVRHPAATANSQVRHPSTLIAPRRIRLVQASESDTDVEDLLKDLDSLIDQNDGGEKSVDELTEQAKELLDNRLNDGADKPQSDVSPSLLDTDNTPNVDPSDSDSLDLEVLDALDSPNPAEDSQSPEEMRDKLKRELDRLLDDEGQGEDEDDPLGLTEDDEDEDEDDLKAKEAEEDAYIQSLVDPTPDAAYRNRHRSRVNMPYTLSNILGEEDRYDPTCVQEYCRQMWQCAGGRCLSPMDRLRRNINRDRVVRNSGCGPKPCSPMKNFRCPKCPNVQPQSTGAQYVPSQEACPPGELPNAEFQPFVGTMESGVLGSDTSAPSSLPEMEAPVAEPPMGLLEPVEPLPADES